ncbi:MAG: ABC transporter ATP-binding protein [candidate division Zixibacteria bacterium]|nr:ABC transporter ATP-binding protein [candidate division Zixibacteria bacterium]NIR66116.1 ABC transporter ATP-binding protein [candidate division Zixibacteria bacterium]NIS17434.1 ABC transporter ATP-binding protein [candidate division Zixibacteria bacterium]NIS47737.1 ABC transporter ATP-binding protein [candidate division Zixibacteria bacterium]NIT53762.1 ABC transporter ATP-binding protein [candidate division Zixibacteria bacterium]
MNKKENNHVVMAQGIIKEYREDKVPVKALRGIDLTIDEGEFAAIVGPSGSGKTTFLNVISGLDDATDGTVRLSGKLLSKMSGKELSDFRRDNIGFIFQSNNLIPVLTVEENVEYVMLLQGVPKDERHERVKKILSDLGLEDMADRRPNRLSGGQQQRVGVARAMVSRPALVLADEPTASLDSETAESLMEIMRELNEESKITFIFSTHDQRVMKKARRLIVLKDGKVDRDETRE